LIRQINKDTPDANSSHTHEQLQILKKRITYVKQMQTCGIVSFILCVFSIFSLFMNYELLGIYLFGLSLVVLVGSLMFALIETLLLNRALMIELYNRSRLKQ